MFIKIAMRVKEGENLIGYLRNKNSGFKLEKKKSNQSLEFILKQKQLN